MHELPAATVGLRVVADGLAAAHGIDVAGIEQLDDGVGRVRRRDGADWVVRVFPASRPVEAVRGDAGVLAWLAAHDFPAERPAPAVPVAVVEGHPVLVTEYVAPVARADRRATIRAAGGLRALGGMLGRLHRLPLDQDAPARAGGAWHHAAEGPPRAELDVALGWLTDTAADADPSDREPLADLIAALADLDDGAGLPEALVHPDPVLANVVATPAPGMVLVDWAGAGVGPRLWPLAFLLWAEGAKDPRRAELVAAGYRRALGRGGGLEPAELDRLAGMLPARHAVFSALNVAQGRLRPAVALRAVRAEQAGARELAARVRRVLGAPWPRATDDDLRRAPPGC